MKKFKRFVAITLIFVMTLSLIACSSPTTEEPKQPEEPAEETPAPEVDEAEGKEGKVLNIWGWNDEFQGLFNNYFAGKGLVPEGVEVKFTIVPNRDNAYQNALDEALLNQENAPDDEKIDLFLVEADYALEYVDTDYTLDIIKDVGLTPDDISGQYKYTQEIVTDRQGRHKGYVMAGNTGLVCLQEVNSKGCIGNRRP